MIKICNILSYQENQSHFWFNDGLISIEKEKKNFFFSIIYPATYIFWHQSGQTFRETEILNTLRLAYF